MRHFLLVIFLLVNLIPVWSQNLAEIEIKLSEAVASWQKSAADLDQSVIDLSDLQRQYDDMVRAKEWMAKNLESRKANNDSSKKIKKARKVYRSGLKQVKKLSKKLNSQQRVVNNLTDKVESNKQQMNKLMFLRDELVNGGVDERKIVYSGYFPKYKSFYHPKEKENVFFYHPKFSCKTDFDGTDPRLDKHRIEYEESVFFTYQPDYLPLVNNQAYLQASTFFTLVEGGQFFLNLNIRIQTDNPRQSYGYLERGSRLFITFMNGDELVLMNNLLNLGSFNRKKGVVVYKGQYSLNVYSQNKIKRNTIDKVRIEWSKGYEDYNIYYVDLLQKQFKCL